MDEIALLRALPPERPSPEVARAAARRALETRFERAVPPPVAAPLRTRRRGFLALAGAGAAVAAGVAAILLVGSGPSAEPAVAKALRQAATVAEAGRAPALAPPDPGQFLYVKTKVVQLEGWLPEGHGKGPTAHPRYFVPISDPLARYALVATDKEVWTGAKGQTRERETLAGVDFLADADQQRWSAAGSPPPFAYDAAEHDVRRDGSGRLLKEFRSRSWRGAREFTYVDKLAKLPTEPEALRLTLEHRAPPGQPRTIQIGAASADTPRGTETIQRLMSILSEPITSPALRAAAFNALAEIPGIELERGVADSAGRRGDAIAWTSERGFGRRFVFDPETSEILAEDEMIFDAGASDYPAVPDDTVFREIAYLEAGVVGSDRETAGGE